MALAGKAPAIEIRVLESVDILAGFSCGTPDLDEWLRDDAVRLQDCGAVAVYIARADEKIVGYLSLLSDCIRVNSRERKDMRFSHDDHPSIPAVKIAHLAVQLELQGQGIGTALLRFASDRAFLVAESVGCRLLTLDAYPERVSWYEDHGFERNKLVAKEAASEWKCPDACPEHRKIDGERISMRLDLAGDDVPEWMKD
jgi:ribosomal protein S18 acetylase RimI-like enzyme